VSMQRGEVLCSPYLHSTLANLLAPSHVLTSPTRLRVPCTSTCSLQATANVYGCLRASRPARSGCALPYTVSPVTQATGRPASKVRSSIRRANSGLVAKVTSSGT
jgi:hypothetical protein